MWKQTLNIDLCVFQDVYDRSASESCENMSPCHESLFYGFQKQFPVKKTWPTFDLKTFERIGVKY